MGLAGVCDFVMNDVVCCSVNIILQFTRAPQRWLKTFPSIPFHEETALYLHTATFSLMNEIYDSCLMCDEVCVLAEDRQLSCVVPPTLFRLLPS